ncbi:MAG: hypothetical protein LR006_02800, partial [Dehalococcoidia bacterium]|nr:hypothetical protein [Dehalococcoidia bacterium]
EILRGACPERNEILRFAQNDSKVNGYESRLLNAYNLEYSRKVGQGQVLDRQGGIGYHLHE